MQLLTIGIIITLGLSIIAILKKGINEIIKGLQSIKDEFERANEKT